MAVTNLPRPVGYVLGGGGSLGAMQVGMLQALDERDIIPGIVAGTSVGSLNGAVVAQDRTGAANRLSHHWARITREDVFPGDLLAQARTLQRTKTHLFPSTGYAAVITRILGPDTRALFAGACLTFALTPFGAVILANARTLSSSKTAVRWLIRVDLEIGVLALISSAAVFIHGGGFGAGEQAVAGVGLLVALWVAAVALVMLEGEKLAVTS